MANKESTQISNRNARPAVLNSPQTGADGVQHNLFGKCAMTTSEGAGSIARCVQVPSNARISSVKLWSAALGGTCAVDIGVYYNNDRGTGAVIDADLFASAVVCTSAINGTEQSHESGVYTIAKREQPLWQAAGLTSDPGGTFDIAATVTVVVGSNGDLGLDVTYTV